MYVLLVLTKVNKGQMGETSNICSIGADKSE